MVEYRLMPKRRRAELPINGQENTKMGNDKTSLHYEVGLKCQMGYFKTGKPPWRG